MRVRDIGGMSVLRIDLDEATTVVVDTDLIGMVQAWPAVVYGSVEQELQAAALSHVLMLLTTRWLNGEFPAPNPGPVLPD